MSQNYIMLENGRELLYGFDGPTGGFFYTEFYTAEEKPNNVGEVVSEEDSMTLSALLEKLFSYNIITPNLITHQLLNQYKNAEEPTPSQVAVGKIFGEDILQSLDTVRKDIQNNFYDKNMV